MDTLAKIKDHIRVVPDFPKPGIQFYDISTILVNAEAFRASISALQNLAGKYEPDIIMGIETRGFIFASALALSMQCGFGMVRKAGKLPGTVLGENYTLEYGEDRVEIQPDIFPEDSKILLVDDLLATGGTMRAAENLMNKAGFQVSAHLCLIELIGLNGREKLKAPFESVLECEA